MAKKIMLLVLYFITLNLITQIETAPKVFSCMSYMEDDRTLTEEDDDDSDENISDNKSTPINAADINNHGDSLNVNHTDNNDIHNNNDKETSLMQRGAHLRTCPTDYTFCFALWRKTINGSHIEKQGCWKESNEGNATCSSPFCATSTPTSRNNSLYYCCCSGDACNDHVHVYHSLTPIRPIYSIGVSIRQDNGHWSTFSLWFIIVAAGLVITSLASFLCYRQSKEKCTIEEATMEPDGPGYSSNLRNVDNLNLICMLGSGKYGTVMKGLLHDQEVAVKIFPEAHHQYFINERNIYSLPLMDSPALLTYYGYDERQTLEGKMEYHLVLSLAPLGNLQDWLIVNTMNFERFCDVVKSITRGLSHLHTEVKRGDMYKPCVAHRDLNTRNILVKSDGSCCISDFGFALKVFGSRYEYKGEVAEAETKSINEVGTLRYMAPELLEGAVNLRDCETSLKQMDVYALGLILWEVAMRCSDFYPVPQITPTYKAPYEMEVGSHPTFDQMQSLVVRHKARPLFPNGWNRNCAAKLIKDTCEDCWDHDAEARLTSLCAEERMHEMATIGLRLNHNINVTTPLSNTNNLCKEPIVSLERNSFGQLATQNVDSTDTSTLLCAPPNQYMIPAVSNEVITGDCNNSHHVEKNHLIQPKIELQPYQGRNPCMERNLVRMAPSNPQPLIQRSKKHSFQRPHNSNDDGEEHSLSCLDEDVSVEELITGKMYNTIRPEISSNMGQGFPKQHNTDKKLKGWHGVRAIIQKRLFRKPEESSSSTVKVFHHMNGVDEKLILVDNRQTAENMKVLDNRIDSKDPVNVNINYNLAKDAEKVNVDCNGVLNGRFYKRPSNLDLSPNNVTPSSVTNTNTPINSTTPSKQTASISIIVEEEFNSINNENDDAVKRLKSLDERELTPSHIVLRNKQYCSALKAIDAIENNNINEMELEMELNVSKDKANVSKDKSLNVSKHTEESKEHNNNRLEPKFRRQRSLEMFREVFNARGSNERLRHPSQRVKTPGDVPPSVRKIRSSKTLSLYDDRMMDSTALNIL